MTGLIDYEYRPRPGGTTQQGVIHMSTTLTPTELGSEFGTDGRTVRKFLRSITPREEQPGKGSRWAIDGSKRNVTRLQKQFNEWNAAQLEERAKRAAEAAEKAAEVATAEVEETED